ncbi:MAG: hypothetical protein M1481_06205 [Candidatus Thermoplasmatota archaeon]|nr:hypothetical protein [Candidatus Thermoplasmatota archaeon]MCL5964060.1 hypothetical protein [Candidatus Thermoplasmatota archaeon]
MSLKDKAKKIQSREDKEELNNTDGKEEDKKDDKDKEYNLDDVLNALDDLKKIENDKKGNKIYDEMEMDKDNLSISNNDSISDESIKIEQSSVINKKGDISSSIEKKDMLSGIDSNLEEREITLKKMDIDLKNKREQLSLLDAQYIKKKESVDAITREEKDRRENIKLLTNEYDALLGKRKEIDRAIEETDTMLHQKEIALTNLVKELEKKSIEKEEIEHEINLLNEKYNGIKVEIENRLTLIESREKNIAVDEEYINKKKRELEKELEQIKSDREQLIRQEESLAEIKQGAIALMRYGEVHEKKHNEMILKEIESKQHNLEEQIKGFNELMNEKEKELSLREHRLQEDMSAIKEKELSLSEKEMWINKQEETYLTDKEKVMEVWSKLKGVLDEIDNREKMIEMKISETFKDRNSENQKKKEEIEKQLVLLKEQENKLSLKEASLENKSNELIQREVLLYKREHDLMEYEKELKKRSEKLDSIKMKLVNNMSAPDEK